MRLMMKVQLPVEAGNEATRTGRVSQIIGSVMEPCGRRLPTSAQKTASAPPLPFSTSTTRPNTGDS
jgi:hypothetical protein